MMIMRYSVIDLGSNTIRMSVFDAEDGKYHQILSEKEMIGLIGYAEKGILSPDGILRVTETMKTFCETSRAIGAEAVHCFATAGLRSIKNAEEIVAKVADATGVQIQIISGEEEARLDFLGAYHPEGVTEGLMVDMGGGSTELVRYRNGEIENAVSLPFGSLNLYKRFVSKVLPGKEEFAQITEFVKKQFAFVDWLPESAEHLLLIGGTARAIARLHRELNAREEDSLQGYTFDTEDYPKLLYYATHKKKSAIRSILRVSPERIHTIVPGLIAFTLLAETVGCKTASISRTGVREGYLKEYVLKNGSTAK